MGKFTKKRERENIRDIVHSLEETEMEGGGGLADNVTGLLQRLRGSMLSLGHYQLKFGFVALFQ